MKSRTALAIAALLAASGFAQSAGLELKYAPVSINDNLAKSIWSDEVPNAKPFGNGETGAFVSMGRVDLDDGTRLVFSQLFSSWHCYAGTCPYRVTDQKGELLFDGRVCNLRDTHRTNATGTILFACNDPFPIKRPFK